MNFTNEVQTKPVLFCIHKHLIANVFMFAKIF